MFCFLTALVGFDICKIYVDLTSAHPLSYKQWGNHGCVVSSVATDGLVLKHQAISIHGAGYILIVLDKFHTTIVHLYGITLGN